MATKTRTVRRGGIGILVAASLAATPLLGGNAASAAPAPAAASVTLQQEARSAASTTPQDLERALSLIESIPDSVLLQGDAATQKWISTNFDSAELTAPGVTQAGFWGCTAAIAGVIASTAIPAAKLLKMKSLIKSLGGVKEAVRIMWGASFSYEKIQALGGAAAALAAEIIGITAVRDNCFS